MTVTCQTEGCGNQGIPIVIANTWTDTDGVEQPVAVVQCGVCLGWIIPPEEPIAPTGEHDNEETPDALA